MELSTHLACRGRGNRPISTFAQNPAIVRDTSRTTVGTHWYVNEDFSFFINNKENILGVHPYEELQEVAEEDVSMTSLADIKQLGEQICRTTPPDVATPSLMSMLCDNDESWLDMPSWRIEAEPVESDKSFCRWTATSAPDFESVLDEDNNCFRSVRAVRYKSLRTVGEMLVAFAAEAVHYPEETPWHQIFSRLYEHGPGRLLPPPTQQTSLAQQLLAERPRG